MDTDSFFPVDQSLIQYQFLKHNGLIMGYIEINHKNFWCRLNVSNPKIQNPNSSKFQTFESTYKKGSNCKIPYATSCHGLYKMQVYSNII